MTLPADEVLLGAEPIRIADVVRIADRRAIARLDREVPARLATAHAEAAAVSANRPVYGRTTGVGANRTTAVGSDAGHGMRLLRSHAVDAGDPLPARAVRAMLAVRLAQLSRAGSGVDPALVTALERMLRLDALPVVRVLGGVGTADLAALAGTALVLTGERPASAPLEAIAPIGADSALAFMSSSALTAGRAMLAVHELRRLDRAGRVVAALTARALAANPEAYSAPAARAAASPGVETVAAELRALLPDPAPAARIQDPYGLRAYAVSQGAVLAALDTAADRLEAVADAAQENPLFVDGEVVHHAAFHQVAMALAIDGLTLALAQSAPLVVARLRLLHEPADATAAPFLAVGPTGSSGHMMTEYVAGAAVAELRASAMPASLGSISLSRGAEEDASFATQAVAQLERAVPAYRTLLAVEALSVRRSLRLRGVDAGGPLRPAAQRLARVPDPDADHDLTGALELMSGVLGELVDD